MKPADPGKLEQVATRASGLLDAMSNKKRLMILCRLADEEQSVTQLAATTGAHQSTVSQHLALLRREGLVHSRRDKQTRYYSLAGHEARQVIETLYRLYCSEER